MKQPKLIFGTSQLPKIKGGEVGFERRIKITEKEIENKQGESNETNNTKRIDKVN